MDLVTGLLGSLLLALAGAAVMLAVGYLAGSNSDSGVDPLNLGTMIGFLCLVGVWIFGPQYLQDSPPILSNIAIGLARLLTLATAGFFIGYKLGERSLSTNPSRR